MVLKTTTKARSSGSPRPLFALLNLLGRRASLRVVWELRAEPLTFRALQDAAQTNPSVLNARLAELREAGIVTHDEDGYGLTAQGRLLRDKLEPLEDWAEGARRASRKRKG